MRQHIYALTLGALSLLAGCSHAGGTTAMPLHQEKAHFASVVGDALPVPSGVQISPPARDLAPQLAAFSGTWQGRWGGQFPSRLIVERITSTRAEVVYIWGQIPRYLQAGWQRVVASVTPGGEIQWDVEAVPGVSFVFTMSADRKTIAGERLARSGGATITMTKVALRS